MDHLNELSDSLPTLMKEVIHIEVCQAPNSVARAVEIEKHVTNYLEDLELHFGDIFKDFSNSEYLQFNVSYITICSDDLNYSTSQIDRCKYRFVVHVYQLTNEGAATEEIEEDEEISAANHWILPSRDFDGMWENLIFDSDVKQELLNYAGTTMLFSDKNIDSNIISCNRVVLLHGPPGTGKTSLCKALAQKLSIRLSNRFRYGQLIEINSHSLFSKWFSESGKLVMKMFQRIQELIDDKEALVFVLIDEVESLTAARAAAVNGSEPSDAIRVVNAVLTQIDHIKKYSNVLILTTSNITGAVDLAFVDRADIKQYIGPPSELAIFSIYHSCIEELKRKNVVVKTHLPDLQTLKMMKFQENDFNSISFRLLDVAKKSYGLSGRTLRKLPFLAYAMHLQSHSKISQNDFIHALSSAVNKQLEDRDKLISESQRQLDIMKPKGSVEEGKKADDEKDAIMVNGFH